MTGGQMAPTTLPMQRTTTSPEGRNVATDGYPVRMAELLAVLEGTGFSARVAVNTPMNIVQAGKTIEEAFRYQVEGKGFSFVEVLSACPTNWGMSPLQANERVGTEMIPYFKLGIFKDRCRD
jgi:2-oxoglutarate ferredoxin oxidoreductase subunit beta